MQSFVVENVMSGSHVSWNMSCHAVICYGECQVRQCWSPFLFCSS